jgi:hypothetical protein
MLNNVVRGYNAWMTGYPRGGSVQRNGKGDLWIGCTDEAERVDVDVPFVTLACLMPPD